MPVDQVLSCLMGLSWCEQAVQRLCEGCFGVVLGFGSGCGASVGQCDAAIGSSGRSVANQLSLLQLSIGLRIWC